MKERQGKYYFYPVMVGIFGLLIYWIVLSGESLEISRNIAPPTAVQSGWNDFISNLKNNLKGPLILLLGQIMLIIVSARLMGWVFKQMGQPSVMGEIVAGIILGPSCLGGLYPAFSETMFPAASLGPIKFLSQIGLILFLFTVGMELNLSALKHSAKEAVVISHASILIPFSLGMSLAYYLYPGFAPKDVPFLSFALFMGIAMSITAFPVLARIVQERNLQKTVVGTMAITCAAVDDLSAWCILAAIIAFAKSGSFNGAIYTIGLAILYVAVMYIWVKPLLEKISRKNKQDEEVDKQTVAIFLLCLLISCSLTELIGIHALFGAFMMGVVMPENTGFRNSFIQKTEDVAVVLLLPLFFVFSGLRTEIGMLDSVSLWGTTLMVILIATVGKFAGSAFTARLVGQNWKDSLMIGALMNTRGLMELVALNIGYELGLVSPAIFTMMVMMALATTLMTGPAIQLIQKYVKSGTVSASNSMGASSVKHIH